MVYICRCGFSRDSDCNGCACGSVLVVTVMASHCLSASLAHASASAVYCSFALSNTPMHLIHKTNYHGPIIYAAYGRGDDDVPFDAIWAQAVPFGDKCCCKGFGTREVVVTEWAFSEEADWWSLYFVGDTEGHSGHRFWKFVLIPFGDPGLGKKSCRRWGWEHLCDWQPDDGIDALEEPLWDVLGRAQQWEDEPYWEHVHVGLKLEAVDTREAGDDASDTTSSSDADSVKQPVGQSNVLFTEKELAAARLARKINRLPSRRAWY